MDAFPTPEADSFRQRVDDINARHAATMVTYRRQDRAATHLMLIGLFLLGMWAVNEAKEWDKRQTLRTQEQIVWTR